LDLQLPVQSVPNLSPLSCEFESRSWRGVLNTTLCDIVCQWLAVGTPVYSTTKTDSHDIIEILLKVALNTITHIHTHKEAMYMYFVFASQIF